MSRRELCYFLFGLALTIGIGWAYYAERYGPCTNDQIDAVMEKCQENPLVLLDLLEALQDEHLSYQEADAILDKYSARYHQRRRSGDFFRRGRQIGGRYHLRSRVGRFFG
jgi:hypothetical protein